MSLLLFFFTFLVEFLYNVFLVFPQLLGKAVGAVKLAVVSYAAHEPHLDLLVVEVAVKTDDIYFQG